MYRMPQHALTLNFLAKILKIGVTPFEDLVLYNDVTKKCALRF